MLPDQSRRDDQIPALVLVAQKAQHRRALTGKFVACLTLALPPAAWVGLLQACMAQLAAGMAAVWAVPWVIAARLRCSQAHGASSDQRCRWQYQRVYDRQSYYPCQPTKHGFNPVILYHHILHRLHRHMSRGA